MIRRGARHRPPDTPLLHRAASVLLRYPDQAVLARLDDIEAALPALTDPVDRDRLATVTDHLRRLTPTEAAQAYVATFDHTRHRTLHLTYYRHGDTRARGMALLALKHSYRRAGHQPPDSELPDFLPLMLEFAALAPEPGRGVLRQCQAGLELLRQALHERSDPYAPVLDALCGRLPEPSRRERAAWRSLAAEGPPREQVGLEPFAPPEYLTSPMHTTPEAFTSGEGR
ncbi:nitrate reductase molybdenum cofactor assembly chaperone [Streptomyces malaysiensis]|uniref:Nitrate reductase molybdenum cofactor assembly chaperone n=1 Tax=Streptomyces malaysiensis subsp. samsunensis TaxID=459658 RepID=A0A9X2LS03_STRMQ|nr:nitrate reductase molybdenum cofactor assembly chaperone [Streptomyces samsunensis]MCQ8828547.1 nitrate reductase molybdenum cofactor assembly chaperone [Streptomyces samsunensis]